MSVNGTIFDVQHYCIHDGPGIRTSVFFKGCPLRCAWCQNPESQNKKPQLMFNADLCSGCGECIAKCPEDAISLIDGRAVTDRDICTGCGKCVEVCMPGARSIAGYVISSEEVFKRIEADRLFYDNSGGGATLTGGEVLSQPEFAYEILKLCKNAGIHTAVETCGHAKWDLVKLVMEHTDLVLYDLKHMDSKKHKEFTGVGNELILENLNRISAELHKPIIVRIPIIPGFNDDAETMKEAAGFVKGLTACSETNLLAYHRLGISKSEQLGAENRFTADPPTQAHMDELKDIFISNGLLVT